MSAITTSHNLDFFSTVWDSRFNLDGWALYRIGTCYGQWRETPAAYEILSVVNEEPGNGHLGDVFEWFAYACRRSGKPLRIVCTWNERFGRHLTGQRGFAPDGETGGEPDFIRHYERESSERT